MTIWHQQKRWVFFSGSDPFRTHVSWLPCPLRMRVNQSCTKGICLLLVFSHFQTFSMIFFQFFLIHRNINESLETGGLLGDVRVNYKSFERRSKHFRPVWWSSAAWGEDIENTKGSLLTRWELKKDYVCILSTNFLVERKSALFHEDLKIKHFCSCSLFGNDWSK